MIKYIIKNSGPLKGEIDIPGDKSISHRAIIFSSLANGPSKISNLLGAEDVVSTINAFRSMGVEINDAHNSYLTVNGVGVRGLKEPDDVIDAGNSGTTMRLLSGLLAGQSFFSVITGDRYLRKRPMGRIVEPLKMMGADIWGKEDGNKPPLAINGGNLSGIEYHSPIASAQVKSSVLLAGITAQGRTTVYEPFLSRDHTERMILAMGAKGGTLDNTGFYIESGFNLEARDINVVGDISSAAFFIVAALIVQGSEVKIKRVGINPTRTGIIDVLKEMGGDISIENMGVEAGEPIADILVRTSNLKGLTIDKEIIPRLIDEIPVLAVAAAFAEGSTVITGAKELRVKESDRIVSVKSELGKFGVEIEELEDGLIIKGVEDINAASVDSFGDHRIAMAMAVAALKASGDSTINGIESVETSFPGFFKLLESLK